MKPGSWPSIIGIYLLAICGGSTVSKIVPLINDFHNNLGLSAASFGWLVSLVAIPAAIFAIPSGAVVDRLGSKLVLLLASLLGIAANGIYMIAPSMDLIRVARLLEGFAIVHIYTAGPAMLMASCGGIRRTHAMTLWSTYAPVGTATGLALGGIFAEGSAWRDTFALHAGMYAVAGLLCLFQPSVILASAGQSKSLKMRVADLGSGFLRPALVLLALAFFMMISLGLGANVSFPNYLAKTDGLSLHAASTMVATATITMVLGSFSAGFFISKGYRPQRLFMLIAATGLAAGMLAFYPHLPTASRWIVLVSWFVITGAGLATIMATLPSVADPARPGSAAALINFAGAAATFLNPPLWLGIAATGKWTPFVGLLAGFWSAAVIFLVLATRPSSSAIPDPSPSAV